MKPLYKLMITYAKWWLESFIYNITFFSLQYQFLSTCVWKCGSALYSCLQNLRLPNSSLMQLLISISPMLVIHILVKPDVAVKSHTSVFGSQEFTSGQSCSRLPLSGVKSSAKPILVWILFFFIVSRQNTMVAIKIFDCYQSRISL